MTKGEALAHIYSGIFGYPLTAKEAKLWRINTQKITDSKLHLAKETVLKLKDIPFIEAIFITGSVAANNPKKDADIDLMIITKPNTMWLTRFLVAAYLKTRKLYKEIICPNIFLDTNHLEIEGKNLYTAHEVLQAKCLFDRSNIEQLWLTKNKWTREYLPKAWLKHVSGSTYQGSMFHASKYMLLFPVELLAFIFQYLFMRPKMTNEHVGWGYAFFHPNQMSDKVINRYNDLVKKLFLVIIFLFVAVIPVFAEECSTKCSDGSLDKCIAECNKLLDISKNATRPHQQRVDELQNLINSTENNIETMANLIARRKAQIADQEKKLAGQQEKFENKVRDYYVKNYAGPAVNFLAFFMASGDPADNFRNAIYKQNFINRDKQEITEMVLQIVDLNASRKKLEENQVALESQKKNLEITLAPIKKLVDDSKKYQSQLAQTSAGLSARQQQLLAEKTGNFSTSVGDVPPADDPASRPDYNPGFSPAFAGFSFGAPHRKGMSQYGAYGRAKSGQNAETILSAYYPGTELKKDYSTGINITVQGYGTKNIEDYTKGICEVPNSWGDNGGYESLKAQAVAARSYALAYTNNGSKSICATEACQVYCGPKGGNWERAVNDTRGWVLMSGGNPYSAWYAASSGGYNTPGGWDTKCGNQGCWTGDAYEKIAGSPWFYKAWYKPRGSSGSRSHPWLTKDEFVDIVNAVLLYQKDNNNISHLSQTDKSNSDTWSRDEVRNRLGGDSISDVNSVSVSYSTGGYTGSVSINGRNIDGGTFRQIFNIRAPGELYLASTLYNIEKK